jgi:hypothetical protein
MNSNISQEKIEEISDFSWNSLKILTTVKNHPPKQSEILTISETKQKIMRRVKLSSSQGIRVFRFQCSGFEVSRNTVVNIWFGHF